MDLEIGASLRNSEAESKLKCTKHGMQNDIIVMQVMVVGVLQAYGMSTTLNMREGEVKFLLKQIEGAKLEHKSKVYFSINNFLLILE
jgi:hypothetical protein